MEEFHRNLIIEGFAAASAAVAEALEAGDIRTVSAVQALTERVENLEKSLSGRISALERRLAEQGGRIPPKTAQARWYLASRYGYRRVAGEPYTLVRPAHPNRRVREELYVNRYGLSFIDAETGATGGKEGGDEQ